MIFLCRLVFQRQDDTRISSNISPPTLHSAKQQTGKINKILPIKRLQYTEWPVQIFITQGAIIRGTLEE
uniref:Uncharacterized protein n=1 Tax=Anguilla anguilla TaxID=7936 RepID=A0A0E9SAU4_ANGAN